MSGTNGKKVMAMAWQSCLLCLLSAAAAFPVLAKKPSPFGQHSILTTIRTPQDMLFSHMPDKYRASVVLSGEIADEIHKALAGMKLSSPVFEEVMPVKGRFHLYLANEDYALETRDLISGILNPVEILDIIINSVLRYRNAESFSALVKETEISIAAGADKNLVRISLTPKGDRFGYLFEDLGAIIHESWLTRIEVSLDTSSRLVHDLSQTKIIRRYSLDQAAKPVPDTSRSLYQFEYTNSLDSISLPSRMQLTINGRKALSIEARYRKEKNFIVFDSRSVCSYEPDNSTRCLTMNYRSFRFSGISVESKPLSRPDDFTRQLSEAARLSRKASEELRDGKIEASIRSLQKLIDLYPSTPQAVEAKKLLSDLPKGL